VGLFLWFVAGAGVRFVVRVARVGVRLDVALGVGVGVRLAVGLAGIRDLAFALMRSSARSLPKSRSAAFGPFVLARPRALMCWLELPPKLAEFRVVAALGVGLAVVTVGLCLNAAPGATLAVVVGPRIVVARGIGLAVATLGLCLAVACGVNLV
jgi:hypothetical protein